MSEVEKLYELAGVEPINFAKQGAIDFTNTIEIDGKRYPDFTAEKQLRILMLLTKTGKLELENWDYRGFNFTYIGNPNREHNFVALTGETFEDGYCKLLNTLWQDLTEEEKQQVKGILE